ncbi:hypothetical protein [Daejeonella sp.]|uniref:hypothetical protein n=1 Tax=Daejeonella sp. TaxID=2805397 RepID=UPI0039831694
MKKKNIPSFKDQTNSKEELTEKPKQKHQNLHLARGFSFSDHSHGRVNHHSIGYNHEPGTL